MATPTGNTDLSATDVRGEMSKFWEEYSSSPGVNAMMLDTMADELSDVEREEILSMLPDYRGKDVLELGSGIGRFTGTLSENAKSVIAVDFMESFLQKNRETNSSRQNITFLCKNVMDLQLDDQSLDFVFSNWLLMYLSDSDIEILIKRMLRWLRPNGRLFIRESCFKPCGDVVLTKSHNPSIYRSDKSYAMLITSPEEEKSDGKLYGFNVITSQSVQVYIRALRDIELQCQALPPEAEEVLYMAEYDYDINYLSCVAYDQYWRDM